MSAAPAQICEQERDYDTYENICVMSEEDKQNLKQYNYTEGRIRGKKTYFLLEKIPFSNGNGETQWLRSGEVYSAFTDMVASAKKRRLKFGVNSSYRTWYHQYKLWREAPEIAGNPHRAGPRSHMTGFSVDFSGTYAFVPFEKINPRWFSERWCKPVEDGFRCPTRFFWWLKNNAHKYGFKNTVKGEPWHWKFVGNENGNRLVKR